MDYGCVVYDIDDFLGGSSLFGCEKWASGKIKVYRQYFGI